jgi:L-aspartate oxidase
MLSICDFYTLFSGRSGFMNQVRTEVLVIGSGVAGLMVAELLSLEKNVTIITKSKLGESNSKLAQGGIAAATTEEDSWTNHFFDTIRAGVFHNNEELTEVLVKKGPKQLRHLINLGVRFDKSINGEYQRCKEGAHSVSRIFHAGGDATGEEIIHTLINRVKKRCTILEDHLAIDLLIVEGECTGAKVINQAGDTLIINAAYTLLATGGAGQLYPVTSNHPAITGDGLAMAYRAGAILTDLEFMQFHPTMYAGEADHSFLISEAVRGEGGVLVTANGERLMEGKHEQFDLAPRDIVARAIHEEVSPVYLDISSISKFEERFPTIAMQCKNHGVDLAKGMIPVKPGAHFLMGGVITDHVGRTSLDGLFALGEVAHTGVHGANRLASNSLLEGIVFAREAAEWILHHHRDVRKRELIEQDTRLPEPSLLLHELKKIMDQYVGMKRTRAGLDYALKLLHPAAMDEVNKLDFQSIERANMGLVSWLMATSAVLRKESRGAHYRADYPKQLQEWKQKRILRRIYQDDWVKSQERSRTIFY